ncbi:uncharacterized protein LOC113334624 [Papaver somniferum]|uniref:uncharacterized protein LOC113334624 n=1 Tax=Papaver somniferum TaxID=3469 RepID=UPI000E7032C9|nr:uncharacterized protein LOC113334624 [Papaver somniferum]
MYKRDLKEVEVGEVAHLIHLLDGFAQIIHLCMAVDTRKWDFGDEFSVSNCYSSLDVDGFLHFPHKQIWNPKIPLKVSFLVWTLCHDGAPTLETLLRDGSVNDRQCTLCSEVEETQNHLFLHCPETRKLWNYFLDSFGVNWVFSETVKTNIWERRNTKSNAMVKKLLALLPFAIWWNIWKERNSSLYNNKKRSLDQLSL